MAKRIVVRGFAAGALGGLLAFIVARILIEPVIQKAIDYENGRDAAMDALRKAAGLAVDPEGADIFSRSVQRNIGIGVGEIVFSALALGGMFAVTYALTSRRAPQLRPRVLAVLIAGGMFLALYLIPGLKYPPNPPAIGHEDTIGPRTTLYVVMTLISVCSMIGAVFLASHLSKGYGWWNATLIAGAAFIVVIVIAQVSLPPLGHLHSNVVAFGKQATETPLPLRNPQGVIVYPGFPADVLANFRLYSILNQLIIWSTIGLAFGALAERMVRRDAEADAPAPMGPGAHGLRTPEPVA